MNETREPRTVDLEPRGFSRAFEKLVDGPDDINGLLAYAIYEQVVREEASQGNR